MSLISSYNSQQSLSSSIQPTASTNNNQALKATDQTKSKVSNSGHEAASNNVKPKGKGTFVASGEPVVVHIYNSDSGFNNKIYWSTDGFKTRHYINVDNRVGDYTIGTFAEGTAIEFGIANGAGGFYRTGSAASNMDGIAHARVSKSGNLTTIGFEDLHGGGDGDFNDAVISVRNAPVKAKSNSGGGGGGSFLSLLPDKDGSTSRLPGHTDECGIGGNLGTDLSLSFSYYFNALITHSEKHLNLTTRKVDKSDGNGLLIDNLDFLKKTKSNRLEELEKIEISKENVNSMTLMFNILNHNLVEFKRKEDSKEVYWKLDIHTKPPIETAELKLLNAIYKANDE